MESRRLELILHSAKGLNNVKHMGTMKPYAVIWIDGNRTDQSKIRTHTVKKGGSDPVWNSFMEFDVEHDASLQNNHVLVCQIKHGGTLFDRKIGLVKVPLQRLLVGDATGEKVSYPVMIPSGELKGEIILSHKLKENQLVGAGREDVPGQVVVDLTSTADGEVSDPPPKQVMKKNNGRFLQNLTHASSMLANSVSITNNILDLVSDGDDE